MCSSDLDVRKTVRTISANEIAVITNAKKFIEPSATINDWYYFQNKLQKNPELKPGKAQYKWLFDRTKDCLNYGCDVNEYETTGYWTSSKVSGTNDMAWRVFSNGYINAIKVDEVSKNGVRPVITIDKIKLK